MNDGVGKDSTVNNDLKFRQEACNKIEQDMVQFLLQYNPASELKVSDIKMIAARARYVAFDAFDPLFTSPSK